MVRGGVGLMKLKCGEAAKRSATRLPISPGELPFGQLLKSDCAAACGMSKKVKAAQAASIRRVLINVLLLCVRVVRRSAVSGLTLEFDRQRVALLDEV